jgi:hypothetical protein
MTLNIGANYTLWCRYTGDHIALVVNGPAGEAELTPQGGGQFHDYHFKFEAGSYTITAVADGAEPVYIDWDLILDNGVGQSAAVSLVSVPVNDGIAPLLVSSSPNVTLSPDSSGTGPRSPLPFSTGLSLIPEGKPLGMPTSSTDHVSVVGPVVEEGSAALANAGVDLGLAFYPTATHDAAERSDGRPAEIRSDEDFETAETDAVALASTAWIDWLTAFVRDGILGENPRTTREPIPAEVASTPKPADLIESSIDRDLLPPSLEEGMGVAWMIPVALLATRTRHILKIRALPTRYSKPASIPPPSFDRISKRHPSGPVRHRGWLQRTRRVTRPHTAY